MLKSITLLASGIMEGLGRFLHDLRMMIEYHTIIPLIEGLVRVVLHFDPRVYSEGLRVRGVIEGNVPKKSNRFAILVLYSKTDLPGFTLNLIKAIGRSNLNLIIVSNAELEPLLKARLLDNSILLIERVNLGRDFGAYRDALSVLLRQFKTVERLLLLNDSLFYFERGLDQFIARLNGNQDFIGVTEVHEFRYHVQSFALSFGPRVINHKKFRKFWRRFRPINTRRWSIHKGEVGLTRLLTKAGFRPHILFEAAQLRPRLGALPMREIVESLHLLPTFFRSNMYQEINTILGEEDYPESIAAIEAISQGIRSTGNSESNEVEFNALLNISKKAKAMERWSFDLIASKIVATIAERNQIHVGGFLFMKYLGLPAFKRDIFYRNVYTLEDVHQILSEFGEPLIGEVLADLRRNGSAAHLNVFLKLLFRHGSI